MAVAISAEDVAPEVAEACFGNVGAVDDDDDDDDSDDDNMLNDGKDADMAAKTSSNGNSETLPNSVEGNI